MKKVLGCDTITLWTFSPRWCPNASSYFCYVHVKRTLCDGVECVPQSIVVPETKCKIFAKSETVTWVAPCDCPIGVTVRWWWVVTQEGHYCDFTMCFF